MPARTSQDREETDRHVVAERCAKCSDGDQGPRKQMEGRGSGVEGPHRGWRPPSGFLEGVRELPGGQAGEDTGVMSSEGRPTNRLELP